MPDIYMPCSGLTATNVHSIRRPIWSRNSHHFCGFPSLPFRRLVDKTDYRIRIVYRQEFKVVIHPSAACLEDLIFIVLVRRSSLCHTLVQQLLVVQVVLNGQTFEISSRGLEAVLQRDKNYQLELSPRRMTCRAGWGRVVLTSTE